MPKLTLIGLTYSPWTQRARWALDHHRIKYAFEHYMPVVGEPMLRLRARRLTGRISVPVLLTPHGAIMDSLAIAKHADSVGSGSKLVDGHERAVTHWVDAAERALHAARGLVMRAIDRNPRAQEEAVALPLPTFLKRPTARFGTAVVAWKWDARTSESDAEAQLAAVLDELRAALAGRDHLDDDFSFADVAAAGVVQCIQPVADRFIRMQPGTREAWTRPALAARYPDLIEWRDKLFEQHHSSNATQREV